MNTPSTILLVKELQKAGIRLEAHGSAIRYAPKSAITDDFRRRMLEHKQELLAILRSGVRIAPVKIESLKPDTTTQVKTNSNDIPVFFGRIGYIVSMFVLTVLCALIGAVGTSGTEAGDMSTVVVGQVIYFLVGTGLCIMRLIHIGWNPLLSIVFAAPLIFIIVPVTVILAKIYDVFGVYTPSLHQMYYAFIVVVLVWGASSIFSLLCQVLPRDYAKTKKLDLGGKIGAGIYCVLGSVAIVHMFTIVF